MTLLQRRLDRMEANSKWGSAAEIEASEVLFMRIPDGAMNDPRVTIAQESAARKGKLLDITTSPAAESMPFWVLVPLDNVPDALLDARIAELQSRIAELQLSPATMTDATLSTAISALRDAIAQEECTR